MVGRKRRDRSLIQKNGLTPELQRRMEAKAKYLNVTRSEVMRLAVEYWLEHVDCDEDERGGSDPEATTEQ